MRQVYGCRSTLTPQAAQPTISRIRPAHPAAEEILAERFARGEIDEDEYQGRRDTLHAARQESSDGDSW